MEAKPFDPVAAALSRLAADENLHPTLRRAYDKQAPRRFSGDAITGFGEFDTDPRVDEWAEDARRDAYEERSDRANSYERGGFGL